MQRKYYHFCYVTLQIENFRKLHMVFIANEFRNNVMLIYVVSYEYFEILLTIEIKYRQGNDFIHALNV